MYCNRQLETARCGRKVENYSEFEYSCVSCCRQHGVSADRGAFAVRSPASVSRGEECYPGARARGPVARWDPGRGWSPSIQTRFVRRVQAPYQAAPPIFTPTTREVSPLSNAPLCIRQFRLTPFPPPLQVHQRPSGAALRARGHSLGPPRGLRSDCLRVCGLCDWVKGRVQHWGSRV